MEPLTSAVGGIFSYLFTVGTNVGSNFLTDALKQRNPKLNFLWQHYYKAFFSSFDLYSKNEICDANQVNEIKKILEIYYNNSTYYNLVEIFINHTNNDFTSFLSEVKDNSNFRLKLAKDIIQRRNEYKSANNKGEIILTLSNVLTYFYDSFTSTMSEEYAQSQLLEFAVEHKDLLEQVSEQIEQLKKQVDVKHKKLENNISELLTNKNEEIKDVIKSEIADLKNNQLSGIESLFSKYLSHESGKNDISFNFKEIKLPINPPIFIQNGSKRALKVDKVLQLLKQNKWVNLQGINGTGKTQLANLVCRKIEKFYWLDLKSFKNDIDKITVLIEVFLFYISGVELVNDRKIWINQVFKSLPEGTLIILNDLPETGENDKLNRLIISIVNNLENNKYLLTTSNYKISYRIKEILDNFSFKEYYDLNFNEKEIEECLINNQFNSAIIKFHSIIKSISKGNPRIVGSIINYLKNIELDSSILYILDDLLRKRFTTEIIKDTQAAITQIQDEETKELLYRLSLISWTFQQKEIQLLSKIPNKIHYPNEKIQNLIDVWIQREDTNSFQISPLIQDIGIYNLEEEKVNLIYTAIAEDLLASKTIDILNASRVITTFISAKKHNRAIIILIQLYQSAKEKKHIETLKDWGFLNYWTTISLPKEVDIQLKILVRYEQIRLYKIIELDTAFLFQDLKKYLESKNLENSLKVMLQMFFTSSEYGEYGEFFYELINTWEKDNIYVKDEYEVLSGLLWIITKDIEKYNDIEKWLEFAAGIESIIKNDFWHNEISSTLIRILSRKIIEDSLSNYLGSNDSQYIADNVRMLDIENLFEIEKRLNSFLSFFKYRNLEKLEAIIEADIINLRFWHDKDFEEVEEIGKNIYKIYESDIAKYTIADKIGRLYYDEHKYTLSSKWFQLAIDDRKIENINFIDTLVLGAASLSKKNTVKALMYCEKAVLLAQNKKDELLNFTLIKLLVELGISYWLNSNYKECYQTFKRVIPKLTKLKETNFDNEWMRTFSITAHILGYISLDIYGREVPQKTSTGDNYEKPYQGMIYFNSSNFSNFYNPENTPLINLHLSILADGVNEQQEAYQLALNVYNETANASNNKLLMLVSPTCMETFITVFELEKAFNSNLKFAYTSLFLEKKYPDTSMDIRFLKQKTTTFEAIKEPKPSDIWNQTEIILIKRTITPLLVKLMNFHLEEDINKKRHSKRFFGMLTKYTEEASDKKNWKLLTEVTQKIIDKKIDPNELVNLGNKCIAEKRDDIRDICFLGFIFLTNNKIKLLHSIIDFFPYFLINTGVKTSKSIIKYIYVPFVRNKSLEALNEEFVGMKKDLDILVKQINEVKIEDKNAIQLILQYVVQELEIIPDNKGRKWLYDLDS